LTAWQNQDHKCAICQFPLKSPSLDHEHQTGIFRGFLCQPCNLGLGLFKDNILILERAISYLTGFVPKAVKYAPWRISGYDNGEPVYEPETQC
jgi:hypothetical protein